MELRCIVCENIFVEPNPRKYIRKYCSDSCRNGARNKQFRAYYQRNAEKAKAYARSYHQANKQIIRAGRKPYETAYRKENAERISLLQKEYRSENRERLATYQRERYQAQRTQILEHGRLYRLANRERLLELQRANNYHRRLRQAERRARMQSDHKISYDAIYDRDGGVCGICGKQVARSLASYDHIIPLSRSGPHIEGNLRVTHWKCNNKRGAGAIPAQLLMPL